MERGARGRLLFTGHSYDNTGALGASTWRHVKFVEQTPAIGCGGNDPGLLSWQFSSDVCKHCENAGCLEACPTGSIVRTEFGGVFVQPDVCNGCGYCVVGCPFGVVDRRAGGRPRVQVHVLLRPPDRRAAAGVREGVSDGVDPLRRARGAARSAPRSASPSCTRAA